ncbi:MAG: hypothetical protein IJN70_06525 [Clostridia bacterium]|nr:hypothetical protein [Clostridia bacterium]
MAKLKKQKDYFDSVHIWGRVWSIGALLVLFSLPISISVYYNAWPEANFVFEALLKLVPLYWVTSIIEVITFTPMLGAGGAYLSFVTGNITNLKLPCALNAMEQAKVKSNSEEGEIISTIAVGASAITTTLIIAVGVILFSPVLDDLRNSETLKPAFSYVSAALFGALGASYLKKHWKISIFPVLVGIIILLIMPTFGVSTLLFVTIVAAVVGALVMSKLKIVK